MKHSLAILIAMVILLSAYVLVSSKDSEGSSRLAASRTLSNEVVRRDPPGDPIFDVHNRLGTS